MGHRMNIKPIDILYMLDNEDITQMRQIDLHRLCIAITLDLQLERERVKEPEVFLA
jgi:hypothetical protein